VINNQRRIDQEIVQSCYMAFLEFYFNSIHIVEIFHVLPGYDYLGYIINHNLRIILKQISLFNLKLLAKCQCYARNAYKNVCIIH